jgi:solute carrier family 35, member F1/2
MSHSLEDDSKHAMSHSLEDDSKHAMSHSLEDDSKHDSPSVESASPFISTSRPPIEYTSVGALVRSIGRRISSIWTRRFVLSLLAGQLLSLCITCTTVTTTELVQRNWALPTTQNVFLYVRSLPDICNWLIPERKRYFSLFVIYTPYTIYQCRHSGCNITYSFLMTSRRWMERMGTNDPPRWVEM